MAEKRECDLLIEGSVVTVDDERRVFVDGFVAVDDGRIVAVGARSDGEYEGRERLAGNFLIIPGLVNTHTHLVQGCIRGMAEGTTYPDRLYGYYLPMTGACDEARSYVSALPPTIELARSGVTTTTDDHFTHLHKRSIDGVLRAVRDVGIRCRMARLITNNTDAIPAEYHESFDEGIAETERVGEEWGSDTISVTASAVGIGWTSDADLRRIFDWTMKNSGQFDFHLLAERDSALLAQREGWSGGSIAWLADRGLLGPNVLGSHAQNLHDGEHDLLAEHGVNISLVPDMNLLHGLTEFDARNFLERDIVTSLGLDGPVVSYHHNLWETMKSLILGQRVHNRMDEILSDTQHVYGDDELWGRAELAFELATIGGARAVGLGDRIGSLEAGKEADIVVIDLAGDLRLTPPAQVFANLVYSGGPEPASIVRVLVGGQPIIIDGEPTGLDRREAVANSDRLFEELVAETGIERYVRMGTRWQWIEP